MIIHDDRKRGLASLLLGKSGKAGKTAVKPEKAVDEKVQALKSAAEDLLMGIENKSAMEIAEAYKAMHEICTGYEDEPAEEEEEDEDIL